MSVTHVDVNAVLDGSRFRGLPLVVMAFAACITILDGFDIQIMGLASPALARDWGIERPALVPAFAAALIGMAVGGFVLGAIGDRYGRRPAIMASVLIFAVGTLATTWVPDVPTLIALRFLTGVGLGGALPNATALMSEFAPPRFRGQAIAAAIIGVPIGGMLGAVIAAQVVPIFGWRVLFAIGGILPLVALAGIYFALPESARFLVAFPGRRAELARVLNRVVGTERFAASQDFSVEVPALTHHSGPRALLSPALWRDTTALWLAFITNLFAVYCFYNWAPVVFTGFGMDMPTALRGLFVFNAAGVVGSLAASWLIARAGSRWIQTGLGVVAILSLLYVRGMLDGSGAPKSAAILTAIGIAGFCIVAIQVTLFSVSAHVYPTHCRAAGVGWAQGVGRFGGVLSALAGAMFVGTSFFTGIAATLALTVAALLALRNHLPPVFQNR
jgi:MFS transporter, AAHS family, 4-hydroxybenzoate transporter